LPPFFSCPFSLPPGRFILLDRVAFSYLSNFFWDQLPPLFGGQFQIYCHLPSDDFSFIPQPQSISRFPLLFTRLQRGLDPRWFFWWQQLQPIKHRCAARFLAPSFPFECSTSILYSPPPLPSFFCFLSSFFHDLSLLHQNEGLTPGDYRLSFQPPPQAIVSVDRF